MAKNEKDKHTYNIVETRSKEGEKQVLIDEKIKAMIPAEVTSPAMRTLIGLISRFSTS